MRIDSIQIDNFRGIDHLDIEFDPHFTLLVGDNGSGKTSILSAVSVALGIWHVSRIVSGAKQWRNIMDHEVREVLGQDENGERQFSPAGPVQITAIGSIGARPAHVWTRRKRAKKSRTVDQNAGNTVTDIHAAVAGRQNRSEPLPLLAYYGAGRAWMASNEREAADLSGDLKGRQADGYYDCLNERIRIKDVIKWFVLQAAARDEAGRFKPAYEAVRLALARGIPDVREIYWDHTKSEIVVAIDGIAQPFSNLSDGQRTMASTLADMAIRAVALNIHLLGNGNGPTRPEAVLDQTPGVVLIDEADVHLHPSWQRKVPADLRRAFPNIQFICTSHSPQVFGELPSENILLCDSESGEWRHPARSLGMDSSRVLDEEMNAASRNQGVRQQLSTLAETIEKEDFEGAQPLLKKVEETLGEDDPEVTRARTLISFLKDTK